MSRLAVAVALLAASALLAPPAAAQASPLAITKLPAAAATNSTRMAITFQVDYTMPQGSCPGGGVATIALAALSSNEAVKATVQPVSITYDFGQLDVVQGRTFSPSTGIVVVEVPDLVTAATTSDITVKGTSSVTCAAAAPAPSEATAATKATFTPELAEKAAANNAVEAMPGFELPLVALGLLAAVFVVRRRKA